MKRGFERWVPPGMDVRRELSGIGGGLVVLWLFSLQFFIPYMSCRNMLYVTVNGIKSMKPGAVMPDFVTLTPGIFGVFPLFFLGMVVLTISHFHYHRQGGSRPIYLMRRLPNRWEYWRRCLTLPLLGLLAAVCLMCVLFGIYFAVYLLCTPPECLTPDQWIKIWRVVP